MHCVAGDGLGIIVGAAIATQLRLAGWAHLSSGYVLGFEFGWTVFQALAMREMAGGSDVRALRQTFVPECVSMNVLMAGFILAYPINWWLVANHLKHGMITVRPVGQRSKVPGDDMSPDMQPGSSNSDDTATGGAPSVAKAAMTLFSIACLLVAITLANWSGR